MPEQARYLYAVGRGLDATDLGGTTGIADAPLAVVSHRGLDAVVSDVALDEFGEDALRRNLEDLAWLEQVARRHDDVVHAVSRLGPTAPLRLATICLDDVGIRRRLDEWHDALAAALDRVEGRSEWSVKLVSPARQRSGAPTPSSDPGAGAAYLLRKRGEAEQRAREDEEAAARADLVYQRLAKVAVAGRRLNPQDPRLSGLDGTMTLNAAFLVDQTRDDAFLEALDELKGSLPQDTLHVGGPWPPYSFATLDSA